MDGSAQITQVQRLFGEREERNQRFHENQDQQVEASAQQIRNPQQLLGITTRLVVGSRTDTLPNDCLLYTSIVGSMPLGLLLTFLRMNKSRVSRGVTGFFVYIMRGTPLLLQLYFIYYGLPFIPGMKNVIVLDRLPVSYTHLDVYKRQSSMVTVSSPVAAASVSSPTGPPR